MSIPRPIDWPLTSLKNLKAFFTILDELGTEFFGINGHFDSIWDYNNHTLQYETLSQPSVDSELTPGEVELVNDATPAFST